jgi:hypothetical protein
MTMHYRKTFYWLQKISLSASCVLSITPGITGKFSEGYRNTEGRRWWFMARVLASFSEGRHSLNAAEDYSHVARADHFLSELHRYER